MQIVRYPRAVHEAHPTQPAASLAARSISRSFGSRLVLDQVTLERGTPGVIGLLGANGAGKTTLLRIIAQLTAADAGRLEVCGRHVEHADDPVARRHVGWAPHEPLAWRDESVERNLRYAARLADATRPRARAIAAAAIALWQLDDVAREPVRLLSRGWAQRYSLARADLLGPPLLLLDEPTTGLDAGARSMLEDAIEAWRRERIVVVASHERDWLTARSDQLLELEAAP
ncbi:MAG: transporter ATP-binding protein [Thermoleophilia bacterium]|nr:transporter ATP-binding protein [Thermoleophilia bacterium]